MAPARVRWRGGRSRAAVWIVSTQSVSPHRTLANSAGDMRRMVAAASSMASGMPSNLYKMSVTAPALAASTANAG